MVSFTVHLAVIKLSQFPKPIYNKVKSKAYYCECYKKVLKAETKTLTITKTQNSLIV